MENILDKYVGKYIRVLDYKGNKQIAKVVELRGCPDNNHYVIEMVTGTLRGSEFGIDYGSIRRVYDDLTLAVLDV